MTKIGKWNYSPDELAQKILDELMELVKPRWENAKKTAKDIFEKTLKQIMQNRNKNEVKESLKPNEKNSTLKLNTNVIVLKDVEYVVKEGTTTLKNIYQLHEPNDFVVHFDDKDEEDEEEDVEIKYDELDNANLDDDEEEHEATGGRILETKH